MRRKIGLILACILIMSQIMCIQISTAAEGDRDYSFNLDFSKYEDGTPLSEVMAEYPNVFPAIDDKNSYKDKLRFAIEDGKLKVYSMMAADVGVALEHFTLSMSQFGLNSGSYYVETEFASVTGKYTQLIIESTINSNQKDMTCSDFYAGNQMRVKLEGSNQSTKYADNGGQMVFTKGETVGVRYLINVDDRQIDGLWMRGAQDSEYRQALVNNEPSFAYRRAVVTDSEQTPAIGSVKFGAATTGSCGKDELLYTISSIRIWESEQSTLSRAAAKLSSANLNIDESGVISHDITVPTTLPGFDGVNITWESDNKDIISDEGQVTLPAENTGVTLIATLEKNGVKLEKKIKVLVRGRTDREYILFYETFPDADSLKSWDMKDSAGGAVKADSGLTMTCSDTAAPTVTRRLGTELFNVTSEVKTNIEWAAENMEATASATIKSSDETTAAAAQFRANDDGYDLSYAYSPTADIPRPSEEYAHNAVSGENTEVTTEFKINPATDTAEYWFNGRKNPEETVYTVNHVDDTEAVTIGFDGEGSGKLIVKSVTVSVNNNERLAMNEAQLTWDMLSQQNMDEVTFLTLPTVGVAGVKIDWSSSNPGAVTNEGVVNRSEREQPVTLTAKIYKQENPNDYKIKDFNIKVKALNLDNMAYQKTVSGNISAGGGSEYFNVTDGSYATAFISSGTERTGYISVDLGSVESVSEVKLYEEQVGGKYKINKYTVQVSEDGTSWKDVVSADSIGAEKALKFTPEKARYVRLNITGKESGAFALSEFEINFSASDEDIVEADLRQLMQTCSAWPYIVSGSMDLPAAELFGSTISWESDHPEIISGNGSFRSKPSKDTIVILTATVRKGTAVRKTTFRCLVEGSGNTSDSGGTSGGGGGGGGGGGSRVTGGTSYIPPRINSPEVTPPPAQTDDNVTNTPEPTDTPANDNPTDYKFDDLGNTPWAAEAINALLDKGVVSGDGSGKFYPNRSITREEFARMVVAALGVDIPENAVLPFADCAPGSWYYEYVAAAFENELISGLDIQTFGLGRQITRQDMVTILYRAISKYKELPDISADASPFDDESDISGYAAEGVNELHKRGLINGDGGRFRPMDNATRAEAAVILYTLIK